MSCVVLVTGGAGFIGSHAVLALLEVGLPVVVLDNLSTGNRLALPDSIVFYDGDVGDTCLIDRIVSENGVSAILHFAGSIIVSESTLNPLKYYHNNTESTRSLIQSAIRNKIHHFIFSSTAAVYGASDLTQVNEATQCRPINPYGSSKLMSEVMLADVAKVHPMNYAALRYFNVAGADPSARTGQSTPAATHLIKVALEAALGKRASVTIFGDDYDTPDGTGVRDYIHVSDLASAHVAALARLMSDPTQSLTINCGYGRGASVMEVLDAVDRVAGVKITRIVAPRRAGDPAHLVAAVDHIHNVLDWTPRYASLDTIITHSLAWERVLARRALS